MQAHGTVQGMTDDHPLWLGSTVPVTKCHEASAWPLERWCRTDMTRPRFGFGGDPAMDVVVGRDAATGFAFPSNNQIQIRKRNVRVSIAWIDRKPVGCYSRSSTSSKDTMAPQPLRSPPPRLTYRSAATIERKVGQTVRRGQSSDLRRCPILHFMVGFFEGTHSSTRSSPDEIRCSQPVMGIRSQPG